MTINHAHFESLCTLAASGQLSDAELAQLHAHRENCPDCSERISEFSQLGAQLFCTHALAQPRQKLPKEMLDRFIQRANRDGVPLRSRPSSIGIGSAGMALLFAVFTIAATLHFSTFTGPAGKTGLNSALNASGPDGNQMAQRERSARTAHSEIRPETSLRPNSRANHRPRFVQASAHASGTSPRSQQALTSPGLNQFDLTEYTRSQAKLPRPFQNAGKLAPILQWSPSPHTAPTLNLDVRLEFSTKDPPRLLAEYEQKEFAPWTAEDNFRPTLSEAEVLRPPFDPNAYRAQMNSDLKVNLPVFQFARTR